jgi:hypothetical protein
MNSIEFEEGYKYFLENVYSSKPYTNPYDYGSRQADEWLNGYRAASMEYML